MSSQIPQHFIQDLLARIDIVDLIQARVPIKRKGANYLGLCPFHNEKSPSFTVSVHKQFYHCFGCGKHDNAIGFLMDFEHLTFVESIEELARQAGLEVPRDEGKQAPINYDPLFTFMKTAALYYQRMLREHPHKDRAVSYLKKRGLNGQTAKAFGLGLAPDEWDGLLKSINPSEADISRLLEVGLLSQNEKGRVYDRFRDRIMFPIHDKRGRVIGFGGRVIDKGEPKYLNSPETPIFHKGRNLYGLYEAKQKLNPLTRLLIVEGYMDVVMLAQAGIHYAVATLGTATTAEHLRLLKQECDELFFCFDGDKAGREAASRALKICLPLMTGELDIRFLFLPEGEDPDSLVQKEGKIAFEQRLHKEALPLFDFLLRKMDEGLNLNTLAGKSRWILRFQPFWNTFPGGPFRTFVLDSVAHRFGLSAPQMEIELDKKTEDVFAQSEFEPLSLEEKALALLIQNPKLSATDTTDGLSHVKTLSDLIALCQSQAIQTCGQLMELMRSSDHFESMHLLAAHPYPNLIENIEAEWRDLLSKIIQSQNTTYDQLLELSRTRELTQAEKEALTLSLQRAQHQ